ncbi:quinone oxidoreductase family protein [Leifsonia sp. 22587]|uniref:quinone oxidoreductase family protein n=1 Tax=Leifsonia sp. 22587 TaxID=3453946 RepID=UPI003F871053
MLSITSIPIPVPRASQVLIQSQFAGLNFADVLARRGVPGYATRWPFVPGMEVAGIIVGIGEDVTALQKGDRVLAFTIAGGSMAEFVVAAADLTIPIPAELDAARAATIPLTWATATGLARRAHAGRGDSALITSASGGVGRALSTILQHRGLNRIVGGIGMDKHPEPGTVSVQRNHDFFERARKANGGERFNLIFESVGGEVLHEAFAALAPGGTILTYGGAAGEPDPQPPTYRELRAANATLSGFSILGLARSQPECARELMTAAVAHTGEGLVIPAPRIVTWSELIAAHTQHGAGKARGKAVLAVGGDPLEEPT